MSKPQKIVIRLGVPNVKNRSKAMQLASKSAGVNSVAITGEGKDRLEVVGEGVDIPCLVNRLRNKVCSADIVEVEEVKDKKKEEEAKKKKEKEEEEEKKKAAGEELLKLCCPHPQPCRCSGYGYPPLPVYCEEPPPAAGCHIM